MKTTFTLTLTLLLAFTLTLTPAHAQQYVLTKTLTEQNSSIYSIAFKDDSTLISGDLSGDLRAWNVNTGSQRWQKDAGNQVLCVAIPLHDPFFVAYGGHNNHKVRMRYTNDGGWRGDLTGHTKSIRSLAFKPQSYLLASGSADKTIRIWNCEVNNWRHVRTLHGHTREILAVAWSPDGTTLASGSYDGTVRLWNPNNGINFAILRGHTEPTGAVAWHPDGNTLASGSWDDTIRLWNINTERTLYALRGHTDAVRCLAFHPNGHLLVSGSNDKTIRIWGSATGTSLDTLRTPVSVVAVAFNSTGDTLASGASSDMTIRIWESLTVDVTGNGTVNINDLLEVAKNYGKTVTGGANPKADVNDDGKVDIKDIIAVAQVINASYAQVAPTSSTKPLSASLRAQEVRQWLSEARGIEANAQAIAVLDQLLAALTQPEVAIPTETALFSNYPNPFNPETWIPYQLASAADVTVTIHASDGRLVRTLALGQVPAGVHQNKSRAVYWNGTNDLGERVASGVYFYTLTAGEFTATQKMLIRK